MYVKLNNQKEIIEKAIKKAGSYRKLSKLISIPRSSLVEYHNKRVIQEERFKKIIDFLNLKKQNLNFELLEDSWKQKIGGKNSVKSKIKKGTYKKQLETAQKLGALKLKEWHRIMKKNNPREYHLIQYSRFKKIRGYKHKTKKGELVRNIFEKETADELYRKKIPYEYEPLVEINGRYFFPDFLIDDKTIIECTMWKGEIKAYKLKEKIKHLKKRYKIFVLVPKHLNKYYKILNSYLINKLDDMSR